MYSIAIAADRKYTKDGSVGPWFDDEKMQATLQSNGHQASVISWEDTNLDLLKFDSIFVSSTWNGCIEPDKYTDWLDACEIDNQRRLINDRTVLDAGFCKYQYWHILESLLESEPEIQRIGHLTPSNYYKDGGSVKARDVKPLAEHRLADILTELDQSSQWSQSNIVLKPVISGDGINTFVYNRFGCNIPIDDDKRSQFVLKHAEEAEEIFQKLARDKLHGGVLLQPYMNGVEVGEYSLTVLGRTCTHAIQKPALFKGDNSRRRRFVALDQLPNHMIFFAESLVGLLDEHFGAGAISRARVDLFYQDETLILCELECVEPNTNLKIIENQSKDMLNDILQTYASVIESRTAKLVSLRR